MTHLCIRPLQEAELSTADAIFRLAFGSFFGLADPSTFWADTDYIRTRYQAYPSRVFAAEADGRLVGTNVANRWGSVGFFGPLSVHPDFWDQGIGQELMEPILNCFALWETTLQGLFTFPHSPKHLALYQKFGFWPRFLTPILSRPISHEPSACVSGAIMHYSALEAAQRGQALQECLKVGAQIYEGLDLSEEIEAVERLGVGETVLLEVRDRLVGFAVCHCGAGTEAAEGACLIKFGAVCPGTEAAAHFVQLLLACEQMAAARGLHRLVAGVNTACEQAYSQMLQLGFRADLIGIAMLRPNTAGYHRPDSYVLSDWR
ncbi:GNAT family N-acetyltransferase [Ktedonosporobacter rubrisoli]|uniref:GNAT family N-acetyltransferase n=1 Tax=Ktedonosporobacter rubrisoli TaxID=2509675 RepID=A0A4P6JY65_KTERU|nr:GNAT family N-acetyltransferase [Ktedonosporobacter rubrisoli]QBD80624.1 GNAT family N-acetyltransferase [Ktedonosporobacter rubrisoli]